MYTYTLCMYFSLFMNCLIGRKVKLFSDKIILIFYYISKYTIPHTVVLLKTEYELSGVSMQISSCEVSEHTFLINFSYIE